LAKSRVGTTTRVGPSTLQLLQGLRPGHRPICRERSDWFEWWSESLQLREGRPVSSVDPQGKQGFEREPMERIPERYRNEAEPQMEAAERKRELRVARAMLQLILLNPPPDQKQCTKDDKEVLKQYYEWLELNTKRMKGK